MNIFCDHRIKRAKEIIGSESAMIHIFFTSACKRLTMTANTTSHSTADTKHHDIPSA